MLLCWVDALKLSNLFYRIFKRCLEQHETFFFTENESLEQKLWIIFPYDLFLAPSVKFTLAFLIKEGEKNTWKQLLGAGGGGIYFKKLWP